MGGADRPPDPRALDRAAELIRAASRPVVIAGLEAQESEAAGWLRAFAEALPSPVLTTSKAREVLPEAHPLALGTFAGDGQAHEVLGLADLIVAFGLGQEELTPSGWPEQALVVCVARKPHASHPFTPLVEVVGEPGVVLGELAPLLRRQAQADWDMFQIDRLKKTAGRSVHLKQ